MISKATMQDFLDKEFPQSTVTVEALEPGGATVRQAINQAHLRPGGTVSGPVLMTVADIAMYVALLGEIGIVPLAVTTNLNINFLRKPAANCAVLGECRLLKVGKSLAVGEVYLYSEGMPDPVAHVVATYSIPARSSKT
jgi:acyl-coenzyme A thioesterase PaaI-like protein